MFQSVKSLIYIDGLLLVGLLFFRWALAKRFKTVIDLRVGMLVLLLPVGLFFAPSLWVAYSLVALAAMFASSRPELCAGYLLMLPLIPELSYDISLGGVYVGRFSTVLALGLGALAGLLWTKPVRRLSRAKYDLAAGALTILFTIINARGFLALSYVREFVDYFLALAVPYILISRSIGSEDDARRILSRFYLAGTLCALIAVFEATRHWALYDAFPARLGVPSLEVAVLNIRAGFMRSGGPFLNPTAFALFLAILPVGLWGIRFYFHRTGYWAVGTLLLIGLAATQSRGAWLACVAGYCALWAYRGRWAQAGSAMLAGGLLYVLGNALLPEKGRLAEALGRSGAAAGTIDYRQSLWTSGLRQIHAHPLFGQSLPDLRAALTDMVQGQGIVDFVNTPLFVTMGAGLVGLAAWFAIWSVPFVGALRGARVRGRPTTDLQLVPETMLVVGMVALCFTSSAGRALAWPVIALGLTAPLLTLARRDPAVKPA